MRPPWLARWVGGFLLLAGVTRTTAGEEEAAQRAAQTAREEAKQAGFKLEYRELLLVLTPEEQSRAAVITNAGFALRPLRVVQSLKWMEPVVRGAARCGWQSPEKWDQVAAELQAVQTPLDMAMSVLQADQSLRFLPLGPALRLPHLAGMKQLAEAYTARMGLALGAGNMAPAWTNLLAVTALAISYEPEPIENAHLVRAWLVQQAYAATWEALRTNGWTDAQLSELTARWSQVDLFRDVPELPMFQAAQLLGYAANLRTEFLTNRVVMPELPVVLRQGLTQPGDAWDNLKILVARAANWRDYANRGSYLDEACLTGFYQKQAGEYRRASKQADWRAMGTCPGVTSQIFLQLTNNGASPLQSLVNSRALFQTSAIYVSGGGATTILGRLAIAEARRRLLLTALAIERECRRQGHPPKSLAKVPGAVSDFITGEPLQYRTEADGSFVLYSAGLDGEDSVGEISPPKAAVFDARKAGLVWPRLATAKELRNHRAGRRLDPTIDPLTGSFRQAVQPFPEPEGKDADDPP